MKTRLENYWRAIKNLFRIRVLNKLSGFSGTTAFKGDLAIKVIRGKKKNEITNN